MSTITFPPASGDNSVAKVSMTDNSIVRANSTNGAIQESAATIDDAGNLVASGLLKHGIGWRDNIQPFVKGAAGVAAPTLTTLANGARLYAFANADSVHVEFHIDHDIVQNSTCYPHVHFISSAAMTAGQTVIWEFIYVKAKGHSQGQSFLAARTTLKLTYVADGTEIAGEHIVLEHPTGFTLVEPDEIILAEYKKTGGTHGGTIYGIMGDLHYQSDREVTVNKAPNFYA